jgi:hypothetical protein
MIVVYDHVDNISAIVMRALQRINQLKSGTEYGLFLKAFQRDTNSYSY